MAKTNASPARARRTTKAAGPAHPRAGGEPPPKRTGGGRARLPDAVAIAVRAAREKQATDLVVLDLRKAGGFTDYFVICTGNNPRQITAIADSVRDTLKKERGERPTLSEGVERSEWVLLDYFNFVVHVFSRDCRTFYALERLWGNAERIEFPDGP